MAKWEGKTRGGLLGYKIFAFFLRNVGLWSTYLMLYIVAFYFLIFSRKSTKPIFQYFKRLGQGSLKAIISSYRNYHIFGQSIIDKVAVMSGLTDKFTYHFDGEEHLHQMVQENTGGILISAHLGNWEIAGHFLNRLKGKVNIVMFDAEHQKIKDFIDDVTGGRNFNVIVVKDDFSHIIAMRDALRKKEIICIHGDRFVEGSKILVTEFLGDLAIFPNGPFYLPVKFKVPYSFVFAMKEGRKHYHFFATPGQLHQGTPKELLEKYVANLENKVRDYPLQWFNYYNFWAKPMKDQQLKNKP